MLPKTFFGRSPSSIWATVLFLIGVLAIAQPCRAQHSDGSFREFERDDVPTPNELFQKLAVLRASQGLNMSPDSPFFKQLESIIQSRLEDMTPEAKQAWAEKIFGEGNVPQDLPSAMNAAKKLQESLGIDPSVANSISPDVLNSLLERFGGSKANPPQPNNSRNNAQTPRIESPPSDPFGSGSLPANSANRNSQNNSRSGRNSRSNSTNNQGQAETGGNTRGNRANSNLPNSKKQRNPNQSKWSQERRSGQDNGPQEFIGNRFDRILVEAAQRAVESQASSNGESGLGKTINSAFDRLLEGAHDVARSDSSGLRNELRQQWGRIQNRASNEGRRASRLLPFGGWQGSINADSFSVSPWFVYGFPLFLALIVIGWFALRQAGVSPLAAVTGGARRFRMPKIRKPADLVVAVDRLLLAKFGQTADWWHARHAEAELCESHPQLAVEISELFGNYEHVRYTTRKRSLTANQLSRSIQTLTQLVTHWPKQYSAVPSGAKEPAAHDDDQTETALRTTASIHRNSSSIDPVGNSE